MHTELKRLVAEGKDPASLEAQALARHYSDLVAQFTHGDVDIEASLKKRWQHFDELPAGEKPMQAPYGKEEAEFLGQAVKIYRQGQCDTL